MDTYYGEIYFRSGNMVRTGGFSGAGAEMQCERHTQQQFDQYMKMAVSEFFQPTRYVIKVEHQDPIR